MLFMLQLGFVHLAQVGEIGALRVVLKSGSKVAIDLITSGEQCFNKFESILSNIQVLLRDNEVFFNFVALDCNSVTYELACNAFFFFFLKSCDFLFLN